MSAQGVAPAADWSVWERDGRVPRSGDGSGMAVDWRDDLEQFVSLGCTDWRLTVEWARVEPEPGRVDTDALDFYRDVLAHASGIGLASWITLQHGSLPGWYLDDEGGHRDPAARERFWLPHVDRVAEAFDEWTVGFTPIEDPISWAMRGYGLGSRPPGRPDPVALREAVEGAVLAVHDAVRLLEGGRQDVMCTWRAEPLHSIAEEDGRIPLETRQAARWWDELLWGSWLRAHANGMLELDGRSPLEVPLFVSSVDHVGLVHDHPIGVTRAGGLASWPAGAQQAGTGFAPEPDELAEAMGRAHEALPDHSLMVAAHGVATEDEAWRDHLLARSLDHVRDARDDGRIAGYFHDSAIDGYDWALGFQRPRGLLDRGRSRKPAAETFTAL